MSASWELHRARWARQWSRKDLARDTFDQYARDVRAYLDWCDGQAVDSAALDAADLFVDHVERSRGAHAGRHAARAIKAYGRYLADEYERPSPFARLRPPREPDPVSAPTATRDDLSRLLATCDRQTVVGLRDAAIIWTLCGTGIRRGELAAMRTPEVDLVAQRVHVPKTKTRQPRTAYLPDETVGAMLRYLARIGDVMGDDAPFWLACSRSGSPLQRGLTANGVGQMMQRRGETAGVNVRSHAFRRMLAGEWLTKGGTESGLMTALGWKSHAMVRRYSAAVAEAASIAEAERLFAS